MVSTSSTQGRDAQDPYGASEAAGSQTSQGRVFTVTGRCVRRTSARNSLSRTTPSSMVMKTTRFEVRTRVT